MKNKLLTIITTLVVAKTTAFAGPGISTVCKGTQGRFSVEVAVFAQPGMEGGFRETNVYSGQYPTFSTDLGTTQTTSSNEIYTATLETKAYVTDKKSGVPLFVKNGPSQTLVIDASDPSNIKATLGKWVLNCK